MRVYENGTWVDYLPPINIPSSKKEIRISDLSKQKGEMEAMADNIDSAIQFIVQSIESMRNAGMETIAPSAGNKLQELLSVAKTQRDNLRAGASVLQESMDSMQSIDAILRKRIEEGEISGVNYDSSQPVSDQIPVLGGSTVTIGNEGVISSNGVQIFTESDVNNNVRAGITESSNYDNYRVADSSWNHGDLECTGYALGRMQELGHPMGNISANGDWLSAQKAAEGYGSFISASEVDYRSLKTPALCSNSAPHVLVVEQVETVGNQTYIYFSEGNSSKPNGVIQRLSAEDFNNFYFQFGKDRPNGFLVLND